MKLTKLLTAVLLVATVAFISCKGKSEKDLIVNKWKITNMAGKEMDGLPDSIKTKMFANATMEFMKDGKFESSGMGEEVKKGTYSVSSDGKTLTTTNEGSNTPDVLDIVEISKDKLVMGDKKNDMKITFSTK